MKHLTTLFTILFISLLSSPSLSETVSMDDLVERNDLYYKKFTDVPFTGEISLKVTGEKISGKIQNGKKDGRWVLYYNSGQLNSDGNYKDGMKDGKSTEWYSNGQIKSEENYKDGMKET